MTIFSRYYDEHRKLVEISMNQIEKLITEEKNKNEIAKHLYHRFYDRFLKIFDYKDGSVFTKEYKSGFLMMASSCLLLETLSSFLQGNNHSVGIGRDNFDYVFNKSKEYGNELAVFYNNPIYKNIRNGILHQGETYGEFKIDRKKGSKLFDADDKRINAYLFVFHLNKFLKSYKMELEKSAWDSKIWDNCRAKVRYIIKNSKS